MFQSKEGWRWEVRRTRRSLAQEHFLGGREHTLKWEGPEGCGSLPGDTGWQAQCLSGISSTWPRPPFRGISFLASRDMTLAWVFPSSFIIAAFSESPLKKMYYGKLRTFIKAEKIVQWRPTYLSLISDNDLLVAYLSCPSHPPPHLPAPRGLWSKSQSSFQRLEFHCVFLQDSVYKIRTSIYPTTLPLIQQLFNSIKSVFTHPQLSDNK